MAENVIPFPSAQAQTWTEFSRACMETLIAAGLSKAGAGEFLGQFKAVFDSFHFSYESSLDGPPEMVTFVKNEVEKFASFIRLHMWDLLMARYKTELRLYLKDYPDGPP